MKKIILFCSIILSSILFNGCFDLEEKPFNQLSPDIFYSDETSVKSAISAIYAQEMTDLAEFYWYLAELSADQITWRTWNGGAWGWDEAYKFVLSSHTWDSQSTVIRVTWEKGWGAIGMCNSILADLQKLNAADLKMTEAEKESYIAEIRTFRAYCYYCIYEVWGGVLPLNTSVSTTTIPGSVSDNFDEGCKIIYDFIMKELDETVSLLPMNSVNRMNQATNRMIKMRMLLNSEVFIGVKKFDECAALCDQIIAGTYGSYQIANTYQEIFGPNNQSCQEVIFAFASDAAHRNTGWIRNMAFLPYVIKDYLNYTPPNSGWNCTCLTPSFDNSANFNTGATEQQARCFLDAPYNDKLGAVYQRFNPRDIRRQNYTSDAAGHYVGQFLKGPMRANFGTGAPLLADADRNKQPLVYVDQVGTFQNKGRALETVMSPRWGETNSGIRFIKYPFFPTAAAIDFREADNVEFRLAEVYYTLAECKLRAGDVEGAKSLVNKIRVRYFSPEDWVTAKDELSRGFTNYDLDWMLSEWGIEFLDEGRRRRTDLRRFDKFTQGQWWFFGRTTEPGLTLPAKRDRKYEWFPLPERALSVNPGLKQNPNY
ncbi:MAG TPA: RagB/SusD family nutrient uptake outer membrane protein [Bacteroidales bacterium]|nr:RagB/SusD family nutrient uptake outer membrane protein [Bacteroidales bacterium]